MQGVSIFILPVLGWRMTEDRKLPKKDLTQTPLILVYIHQHV